MSANHHGKSSRLAGLARFAAFAGAVFVLTALLFAIWFDRTFSNSLQMVLDHKPPVITILANNGQQLAKKGTRFPDITLDKLPRHLINAVIATEDRRFFSHWGLDPRGFVRALWNNLSKGRLREGGSTITQQLVKNVYLSRRRTMLRKFREMMIAFWLEAHYSKKQILEHYFNRVYFGTGASHGIAAAAKRFFDKPAEKLDLAESALLAGLLKAPSYYSPIKNLHRAHQRASVVLENMVRTGAISPQQAAKARANPASLKAPRRYNRKTVGTEYALDWIMEELRNRTGQVETDLIVETTIDYDWQIRAQNIVRQMIEANRIDKKVDQAAAVIMDATGGIRAMVGGTSYASSQFNRVTMARRQPGSGFKPVIYLAAMEAGRYPDSIEIDRRIMIKGWRPRNYARIHRGPVTLRQALASSINSVAARLADEVGLNQVIKTARRLGIRSKLSKRPSLALGSSEVTPLEMTAAYIPLMNGGFEARPHIIKKISTPDGGLVFEADKGLSRRIIDREYIYDMNDMLGAVINRGTGKRARLEKHPAAGKTGTSTDYRDAWFIGYTGHFTAGVWLGNDDNSPTNGISGGGLPAVLWKKLMQMVHEGRPPLPLPGLGKENTPAAPALIVERPPLNDIIVKEMSLPSSMATVTDSLHESSPASPRIIFLPAPSGGKFLQQRQQGLSRQ